MEKSTNKTPRLLWAVTLVILAVCLTVFIKSKRSTIALQEVEIEEVSHKESVSTQAEEGLSTGRKDRPEQKPLEFRSEDADGILRVVMDEVALFDEDGKASIERISPPATAKTLAGRIAGFSAAQGVFPVAYEDGDEKNDYTRRYVTRDILAKLPQERAELVAKKHGLTVKSRPSYAPEWVVFSAEQPLDALAKIEGVRGEDSVETAEVLLASLMSKKVLPSDPLVGTQWHIKASGVAVTGSDVNIESTWQYGTAGDERRGLGITVGIVDDGLETGHPDLSPNVNTSIDFDWNGDDQDPNPGVGDDHGTACAGLTGAKGNNGIGVAGTAPASTLVGMRLIAGPVSSTQISEAMTYKMTQIPILSNSWGPGDSGQSLSKAPTLVQEAFLTAVTNGRGGKGTILVWAGGNGGRSTVQDNSNYDGYANSIYTIGIGATDSKGRRADYAEPGANLVVSAPSSGSGGLGVVTTDRTGTNGYNSSSTAGGGDYTNSFGGTSAATPEVAGIVALMLKENPNLGWRDVQEILIRSAKKVLPSDTDWRDNSAGYHFNHNFGAGLVDATAAVALASPSTWTNLGVQTKAVSTQSGLNVSIPNNNATGISRQFSIPTSNIRTEHVTLRLSITHASRGELEISLTSPAGMVSRLAEVRSDTNDDYSDWTFSSVRNWGELSSGTWTLKIADRSSSNSTAGKLTSAELTVWGATAAPLNPAPIVAITSPDNNSLSSPGVAIPVEVSAQDFDLNGDPSTVSKVELFANGVLIGTDTTAPYSFIHNPTLGTVIFTAKATDIEMEEATSASVTVTVLNQTPAITGITTNTTGQAFTDTQLAVTSVTAVDPEDETITLAYQWESSTDEENYVDLAGATTTTLPVSASNAGKLWRCKITASDGNTTSAASVTDPVNILARPMAFAKPGDAYSYQSGLVLKGVETLISRQAIIHEFSQGPNGGTSEWVEILTMQAGSFRNWSFRDAAGNSVVFKNTPLWDSIPAGTLIVIYNGPPSAKDPLLPADSTDAASGKMVIASNNTSYFDTTAANWPDFGSSGDSLFLFNGGGTTIHSLSYGSSTDASPNIGSVASDAAAYYFGDSDAGADDAKQWLRTVSNVARFTKNVPSEKSLTPGATFSAGRYLQDFNSTPGSNGTSYPNGWTSYYRTSSGTTANANSMNVGNGSEATNGNFNYGSQIGIRGTTNNFDPGFIALGLDNTTGLTNLKISYDIVKVDEQGRSMELRLEYATAGPANSSTVWTVISGGGHFSGNSPSGTRTRMENIPLPTVFQNRSTPIYLRWYYQTAASNGGSGARDAIAIDNVLISSAQSPNIFLGLSLSPTSVSEISGTAASVGTITLSEAIATSLSLQLTSSDTGFVTVPASVELPAGQTSVTFPIATIDNTLPDGTRPVTITVAATGYTSVAKILTVTDDEAPVNGVTPGKANSGPNELFINRLRTDNLNDPSLFSLAVGSVLPSGLSLNQDTGLITGTIASGAVLGAYPVTINLTNIKGGITSQTFTINLTTNGAATFAAWVGGFTLVDPSATGDSDLDQLPNLVEYKLNSQPDTFEQPSPILMEHTAAEISLTYWRAKGRDDVSLVAEWSTTLANGTWQTTGITESILEDLSDKEKVKSTLLIIPGDPKRFIRLKATEVVTPP